jgi:hypothetical protein
MLAKRGSTKWAALAGKNCGEYGCGSRNVRFSLRVLTHDTPLSVTDTLKRYNRSCVVRVPCCHPTRSGREDTYALRCGHVSG